MSHVYHVSTTGSDQNPGTATAPLQTINAAAQLAVAGDTVLVHAGEYREWVKPKHTGLSNTRRITYQAAPGEKVVIKGSERITSWEPHQGSVWKVTLDNSLFGDWNPYQEKVIGDWLLEPKGRYAHLGDVYLNGQSFYEAENLEGVLDPHHQTEVLDNWTQETTPRANPEQTKYRWFAEVHLHTTTIYANFQEADPNQELVEINVRKCCFYPETMGINYLTVSGFEMAQAACPWTPPTGDQPGLLGAHWSKGWIIENNIIHDAKCSAISIGKEGSTGHNFRTYRKDKPGYQYQLESVFAAHKKGWSKENIGSHIIRNNVIYDCGQNGIVGHLGCVFSEIYGNHIYNIAIRREYYGHEIAGIKLHAPIDVLIYNNRIHDCSLGLWLDWQAQGTRVNRNLFYRNNRDFFIEVTSGPALVDHNIFASKFAVLSFAQGTAYVHNLIGGKVETQKVPRRATPYHVPHSTDVAGYAMIYGYDDRYYQNMFIAGTTSAQDQKLVGTAAFEGLPTSLEAYIQRVDTLHQANPGDLELFETVEQPIFVNDNLYLNGATALTSEAHKLVLPDFDPDLSIEERSDGVYLNLKLPTGFEVFTAQQQDTRSLGRVRIVDADYEHPDGSMLVVEEDYLGSIRDNAVAGPINSLKDGINSVKVW